MKFLSWLASFILFLGIIIGGYSVAKICYFPERIITSLRTAEDHLIRLQKYEENYRIVDKIRQKVDISNIISQIEKQMNKYSAEDKFFISCSLEDQNSFLQLGNVQSSIVVLVGVQDDPFFHFNSPVSRKFHTALTIANHLSFLSIIIFTIVLLFIKTHRFSVITIATIIVFSILWLHLYSHPKLYKLQTPEYNIEKLKKLIEQKDYYTFSFGFLHELKIFQISPYYYIYKGDVAKETLQKFNSNVKWEKLDVNLWSCFYSDYWNFEKKIFLYQKISLLFWRIILFTSIIKLLMRLPEAMKHIKGKQG